MNKTIAHILAVGALALSLALPAQAFLDISKTLKQEVIKEISGGGTSALTDAETIGGLKEALDKAVQTAISFLGQPGGYLNNADAFIPVPDNLRTAEKILRAVGQDQIADDFITSLNNAAEEAVPETVEIFTKAIDQMTFEDAQGILNGPDDAATQFFQRTSTEELTQRILPIVQKSTDSVGVTRKYKAFMSGGTSLNPLSSGEASPADLDAYVTDKAIDGLFVYMAKEEKAIRENPLERTTDLLKKVFGTLD